MLLKEKNLRILFVTAFLLLIAMFLGLGASAFAQTEPMAQMKDAKSTTQEKQTAPQSVLADLKGITIGMTADEVKDKLGKAKSEDPGGFYYVFRDGESMQITLDADKKVRMISTFYIGEEASAPKYEDVFGAGATIEKQTDGRIYKLVNYPDKGYWVSYSQIVAEGEPMITVTMQKMSPTTGAKQ